MSAWEIFEEENAGFVHQSFDKGQLGCQPCQHLPSGLPVREIVRPPWFAGTN